MRPDSSPAQPGVAVPAGDRRTTALRFIVLLGLVSLLADLTYEGARSISGPYLALLGASGAVVGLTAGLGESLGYGLRLVSGLLADRTRRYWALTISGYALNLLAVPLLALAGRWEVAALLIVLERVGKAIRTPARDAMLAHATAHVGHGRGFGLHEALDQVGALTGPLVVAAVLAGTGDYRPAFAVLLAPALLALLVLLLARWLYPQPQALAPTLPPLATQGLPRAYWLYLGAVVLVAAGTVDFALVAYHLARTAVVPAATIPLLYALAMGIDALAALAAGALFDRVGLRTLLLSTLLGALAAPLIFLASQSLPLLLLGVALWGIGLGAQESIWRAAIAIMVPPARRGSAYGLFNAGYGGAWFLGSALIGLLYDRTLAVMVLFSAGIQLAALPVLARVARRLDQPTTAEA